jgi:hypothetical protein
VLVLRVRETSNSWRPASEIEVAEAILILVDQSFAHETEEKSKPRPFQKPGRIGHPEKPNRSLGVDVLEWYHPTVRVPQWKTRERVGHPPLGGPITGLAGCVEGTLDGATIRGFAGLIKGVGQGLYNNITGYIRVRNQLKKDLAACTE